MSADTVKRVPASIDMIAETIGVRLALKIVDAFGGLDVKFPRDPEDDHPIILAFGKTDGHEICRYMGGQLLYVPHCRPPRSARADIKRLEAEGLSGGEIARRLGISQRWVREVTKTSKSAQLNMFDASWPE